MSKKISVLNVSLVPDADLRPWTKDDALDNKLLSEALALDKAISTTSPQKLAGTRGDSILDSKPDELLEYIRIKSTRTDLAISQQASTLPRAHSAENTTSDAVSNVVNFSNPTSYDSKPSSGSQKFPEVDEEESDARYIDQIQRRLHTSHKQRELQKSPMRQIEYKHKKAPAVLNVSTQTYLALQEKYPQKK